MAMSLLYLDALLSRVKHSVKSLSYISFQVKIHSLCFTHVEKCVSQVPSNQQTLISYHMNLKDKKYNCGKYHGTIFSCTHSAVIYIVFCQQPFSYLKHFSSNSKFKS